jgi:hypothetical protein
MKLLLKRYDFQADRTLGKLYIENDPFCDTLEPENRDNNNDGDLTDPGEEKVWGKTAIPSGTYKIIFFNSPHFGRILPRLQNVPGFDGILIHPGNTPQDTHGCILVGRRTGNEVLNSRFTFNELWEKIKDDSDLWITITNDINGKGFDYVKS